MQSRHIQIWHISCEGRSRAFAHPVGLCERWVLWCRGWRRFNELWWSRANRQVRAFYGE
jgi:hypothetical protein